MGSPSSRGRRGLGQVAQGLNSTGGARAQRRIHAPAAHERHLAALVSASTTGAVCTAIALARLGVHSSRRFDAARGSVPLFASAPRPCSGRLHRAGRRAQGPAGVPSAWGMGRGDGRRWRGRPGPASTHRAPEKFQLARQAAGLPGANAHASVALCRSRSRRRQCMPGCRHGALQAGGGNYGTGHPACEPARIPARAGRRPLAAAMSSFRGRAGDKSGAGAFCARQCEVRTPPPPPPPPPPLSPPPPSAARPPLHGVLVREWRI